MPVFHGTYSGHSVLNLNFRGLRASSSNLLAAARFLSREGVWLTRGSLSRAERPIWRYFPAFPQPESLESEVLQLRGGSQALAATQVINQYEKRA